jgi:hypothetical protein
MDSSHEELASENVTLKLKLKQAEERTVRSYVGLHACCML